MTSPDSAESLDAKAIEELERLEREATARGSARWVRTTDRDDGTSQVYSPSLGPCRVVVPVAETTDENAEFIVALRNNAKALLRLARLGMKAGAFLRAHGDSIVQGLVVAEDSADLVDEEADEARAERAELETLIAFVNGGKNP